VSTILFYSSSMLIAPRRLYLRAMGGWWLAAGSMIIFIAAQFSEIGVSLALRYWAGSYDDRQAPAPFVASTLYASFQHWRSTPSTLDTHSSFLTFGTGNATTDYWLKLYCILAAVNVSLYGLRVAFFLHRGVAASRIIYIRLIDSILGAPSESRLSYGRRGDADVVDSPIFRLDAHRSYSQPSLQGHGDHRSGWFVLFFLWMTSR
jgi:hypothetical protein